MFFCCSAFISVTSTKKGINKELQADGSKICSSMCATCYLWGVDQIYKGLFAGDCSKNLWYHLTFSPKSICLRHQRKAQRDAIKSFIKSVAACNGRGWNGIHWIDSVERGSSGILLPSVCCPVYCNATQNITTIYCNLEFDFTNASKKWINKMGEKKKDKWNYWFVSVWALCDI